MLNTDFVMQKQFGNGVKGKRSGQAANQEKACEKEIDKITAKVPRNSIENPSTVLLVR